MIRWAVEAKMPFFPFFFSPVLVASSRPDDPLGSGGKDALLSVLLLPRLVGRHDPALLLLVVRHLALHQAEVGHSADQASVVGRATLRSGRSNSIVDSFPVLLCLLC